MIEEDALPIGATLVVMVVLGTTIHEFACRDLALTQLNSWMAGSSPIMTRRERE